MTTPNDKDRALAVAVAKIIRTDAYLGEFSEREHEEMRTAQAARLIAQYREEATKEANDKLHTILYDTDYVGGLQYWMRKHDDLLLGSYKDTWRLNHLERYTSVFKHSAPAMSCLEFEYLSELGLRGAIDNDMPLPPAP